jgi:hypothetical protein
LPQWRGSMIVSSVRMAEGEKTLGELAPFESVLVLEIVPPQLETGAQAFDTVVEVFSRLQVFEYRSDTDSHSIATLILMVDYFDHLQLNEILSIHSRGQWFRELYFFLSNNDWRKGAPSPDKYQCRTPINKDYIA